MKSDNYVKQFNASSVTNYNVSLWTIDPSESQDLDMSDSKSFTSSAGMENLL